MHINRQISKIIKKFNKSILLLGPRQTGKSTLISELKPELSINLSDQETYVAFLRDPGLLKKRLQNKKTIFIDEVQKIPSLLNTVQSLIDKDKKLRFFLTGSSARGLRRGHANLLPGRVLALRLGPLTSTELASNFDLDRMLSLGALPGIYLEPNIELAERVLRSYVSTYLREEIQAEALTRNLEGFSRFFDIIASRSGDFVDFTKFSSQASIERTSARRYFDVLVDTLVVNPVPAFTKSSKRRLVQHPRYYFFDVGVLNGALSNFAVSSDRKGSLFEHLCLQLLLSEAQGRDEDVRISVYRTDGGAEVDFILEKGKEVFAIEVKATKTIGSHDLKGLKSFANFHDSARCLIFYLGDHLLTMDGIEILPLREGIQAVFG
jgi:predicted AAA+ superfamily ATPase